jgi:hypothetical protein
MKVLRAFGLLLTGVMVLGGGACHGSDDDGNQNGNSLDNNNNSSLLDAGFVDARDFDGCVSVSETATAGRGPADVIFVIDNTPSMEDEIEEVRANMNAFSQTVQDEGLDLHIILISCQHEDCGIHDEWHGICIDAPVGAANGCPVGGPYDDDNPPNYLHVSEPVPSTGGLAKVLSTYDQWSSMIRDNSAKHVVVVSDDNDDTTAQSFVDSLVALDSRFLGFQAHGIFSYLSKEDGCAISTTDPCCIFSAPDGEGTVYKDLVALTGGLSGDMCLQDFDPVFTELGGAVIASATLSCEWEIPPPPVGEELDPNLVNVEYIDADAQSVFIGRVMTPADCSTVAQGWYYDDNTTPTLVNVCPQTCEWIQGELGSQLTIHFGCEQYIAPVL